MREADVLEWLERVTEGVQPAPSFSGVYFEGCRCPGGWLNCRHLDGSRAHVFSDHADRRPPFYVVDQPASFTVTRDATKYGSLEEALAAAAAMPAGRP